MSVRDRIDDSKLLFAAGKLEGALLSVLVAVAGTARKRYPSSVIKSDREAFEKFLEDERPKITAGVEYKFEIKGELRTLENILYKFARNSLSHEAELEDKISFEYGDFLVDKRGTTDHFVFSSELVMLLSFAVYKAAENQEIFPNGIYDKLPEPVDLKTFGILNYQWGAEKFTFYCSAMSLQHEIREDTGEKIPWVHVKGKQSFRPGTLAEGPTLRIIVPAMYVTDISAGPKYQRTKRRTSCDVGLFPPDKIPPLDALDLSEIEKRIAELQIPMVQTTVTLVRPHYDSAAPNK